jgi:hypothetical protein
MALAAPQGTLINGGGSNGTPHGNEPVVIVGSLGANVGLIRFDNLFGSAPGQIPWNAAVTKASLTVWVDDASLLPGTAVHQMLVPWDEDSSWESMSSGISADDTEARQMRDGTFIIPYLWDESADVTKSLNAWLRGDPNHGWALLPGAGHFEFWSFHSSESLAGGPSLRPKLSVWFDITSLGDMDCNGQVDFDDLDDFTLALTCESCYEELYGVPPEMKGDLDGNGHHDYDDIARLLLILNSQNSQSAIPAGLAARSVPEPASLVQGILGIALCFGLHLRRTWLKPH